MVIGLTVTGLLISHVPWLIRRPSPNTLGRESRHFTHHDLLQPGHGYGEIR